MWKRWLGLAKDWQDLVGKSLYSTSAQLYTRRLGFLPQPVAVPHNLGTDLQGLSNSKHNVTLLLAPCNLMSRASPSILA